MYFMKLGMDIKVSYLHEVRRFHQSCL